MPDHWQHWLVGLRDGDSVAIGDFWSKFGAPLMRLAERNLEQRLRRRIDPEDLVQSAVRTFLRRLQNGQFDVDDSEDLWRLLCAITLNKTRQQVRFHQRQKRGLQREQDFHGGNTGDSDLQWEPATPEPTPEDAVVLVDLVECLLEDTDSEEERAVTRFKLEHLTNEEIAARVGCSERTVRRLLARVRERLSRMVAAG